VKNLDTDLAESRSAGEIEKTTQDVKGSLTIYAAKQLTMGLAEETIARRVANLSRLHILGANLFDPGSVWKTINAAADKEARPWSDGTRTLAAQAYLKFCKITKIAIPEDLNFRKWKNQSKIPWIPLESEVDQLIAACRLRMATFLQLLKETGVRSGEAWRLEWKDIDVEHGIVTVNKPEKNGLPRQLKVSSKLVAMVNSLPKVNSKVWNGNVRSFTSSFMGQRNRIAKKLQNPRMKQIHFHTLRHFFATMLYHKTLNLLEVQQKLGHKSISNTVIYTHLVNFDSDEYLHAHAKTLQEEDALLDAGYEFVRYSEKDQVAIYRKRK
jgi:integrase